MLKGINRQVVEIVKPEDTCFERVLFFVRPEYSSYSEARLKNRADAYVKDSFSPPKKREGAPAVKRAVVFIRLFCAAVGGAIIGALTILAAVS